ncbi:HAD-IIA family hydrolase [Bacteroides sp.]
MNDMNEKETEYSAELVDRIRQIKHVALDMDGTIYKGSTLFPFTIAFLRKMKELGIGYSFLTNNPSKSMADYLEHLAKMGIVATESEFYTSAQATIDYMHVHHPECKRLFILGTPSMTKEFEDAGFVSTEDSPEDEPDAVIVSFDMSLVYSRLCRAAWWINQRKLYIATNPDRVCPTDKPLVLVDCGSICSSLTQATGRDPDVVIGKPDPRMLDGIMERHGLKPSQVAMVGDRVYTDILMAQRAKTLSVLVLSGETTYGAALSVNPRPDIIAQDLKEFQQLIELAYG